LNAEAAVGGLRANIFNSLREQQTIEYHLDSGLALRTKRLLLRDFREEDWESVHVYASDPEVVKHMSWGPNTEEETKRFVRQAMEWEEERPRLHFELAVILKADDSLIGGCGLNLSSSQNREGSLGCCFNRIYWRAGFATEAAETLILYGFEQLGLHRIWATCDPENLASARVLEKVGMKREAQLRENIWNRGKWRDSVIYAILDREWSELRGRDAAGVA
jgi:RimJ/RimL family protein N-acetyltransferase